MPSRSFSFAQFEERLYLLQAHPDEAALREPDHGLYGVEPECRRFKTVISSLPYGSFIFSLRNSMASRPMARNLG